MGMQGYLATVTSISENLVLSQITNKGAWCGGVRYKIGNTTDCFKWEDGPEAGQILTWGNWISSPVQEPNNGNVSDRLYENYIEINADNNTFEWNDLPETGNHTITGFFVEFGNSAPGNSDQGSASVATASIVVTAQSFSYPVTISSDQNKVTVTAPSSITAGDSFEATILSNTDYELLNANDITVTINSTTIDISSYFNAATGELTIPGTLMNGPITIRVSDPTLKWYTANKTDLKEFLSADNWDTIDKDDFQKLKAEWDALGTIKQASVANSLKAESSTYDTALKITQKLDSLALGIAKDNSIAAIDEAAATQKAAIDACEHLSDDEKTALNNAIDNAAAAAKNSIANADTVENVNTETQSGLDNLNLVHTKADAIDAINKKLADETAAVNALENLSSAEKEELLSALTDAAAAAKAAVNAASTIDSVNTAKTNGVDKMNLLDTKANAINGINQEAANKKAAIDAYDHLSDDEKTALNNAIDNAAAAAKNSITNADTVEKVNTEKQSGLDNLSLVHTKADATDAINKKLSDTQTAIDQMTNLTEDEKTSYKQAADASAATAKEAVSNATSSVEIASAKDAGIANLELNKSRAETVDEINRKLSETIAAIDALEHLNSEGKAAQKAAAQGAADIAKAAVPNAGSDDLAGILESLEAALKEATDHAVSADFIDAYLNDNADGTVYDDVTSANIDSIVSGQDPWNNLTEEQKTIVNQTIAALNEEKADVDYRTYQDYLDDVAAVMENSKTAFIEEYVSDEQGEVYKESTVDIYYHLLSGKETWDGLSQAEKNAIDEALVAAGSKPYEELLNGAKDAVDASANDFIGKYVSDSEHNIYKHITGENYAQIISGLETWNNLNQAEKDAVNQMLTEAGGKTYEELFEQAQNYLDMATNAFIKKHMTDDKGKVIIKVSQDTYDKILGAESDFNKLPQDQKDEINRKLREAGSEKTYEQLLAEAKKAVSASADGFIDKYVSDIKKNIYKNADKNNYKQILSGEDVWNSLTQSEKDAVNKALIAAGGKTYEELIAVAKSVEAAVNSPNTRDYSNMPLCLTLMLAAGVCSVTLHAFRKKATAK